ncbi:MAG: hypothetical protein ABI114_11375 [Rhodanobacter sp.]
MPLTRRSRHPLVRVLSLLIGAALVGLLLLFGLAVAGVLLVGGAVLLIWRQWKLRRMPAGATSTKPHAPQSGDVLEGEFVVIQSERHTTH